MCNAWNHSPDCMCGWGGDGHLGRRGQGGFITTRSVPYATTFHRLPPPPRYRTVESFTVPNATCPVCGCRVYFYQSPDGGRVFFDDLGPLWPKHPCTDNAVSAPRPSSSSARLRTSSAHLAWRREGWEPLICREIRALPSTPGWFRLTGSFRGQGKNFFTQVDRQLAKTLFHVRSLSTGGYELSFFEIQPQAISERRLVAYDSLPRPDQLSSSENRKSASTSSETAIALALRKASDRTRREK